MAIQNATSATRVPSYTPMAATPSNPLGVEWVTGPVQTPGLQIDWVGSSAPATPSPAPVPIPGKSPIGLSVEPEHVRIGTPLITKVGNWIADKIGLGSVGSTPAVGADPILADPGLGAVLPDDPVMLDPGFGDPAMVDPTLGTDFSGGTMSGAVGGVSGGISRAFDALKQAASAGWQAAKGALKRNFIFAGITSAISNGLSYFTGKATGKQAVSGFVADTGAYTAIGSASTFVGAAIGTLIPVPFVGTALGIAAGMGLGYLYEKFVRKDLVKQVEGMVAGISGALG